ncbi:MAG: thioredoxin family protein [Arcobacteraceae bacterium]|nr:thioredoxin family protein [Arcobacteraceae bacterium]
MKLIKRVILTLLLISQWLNASDALNNIKWQNDLNEAKELAQHFKKPIFLFLESRKCYYCPIMQEETFSDPRVEKEINENFIPLLLDNSLGAESDVDNSGHAPERLTTSMTPAIYLMGPKEEMLKAKGKKHMIIYGMWTPNDLLDWLKDAKRKFRKLHGDKYEK